MKPVHLVNSAEPPCVGEMLLSLRRAQGLSLDDLSRKSGVSKSMLSQIERNQANPTIGLVWRLANALGVRVAELIGDTERQAPRLEVVPSHALPSLKSPDGRCDLRVLGPLEIADRFEWYELRIEPGGVLASEAHEPGSQEHLTVLTGMLEVRSGVEASRLKHGETARYPVDVAHSIRNPGKGNALAVLAVVHGGGVMGRPERAILGKIGDG